MDQIVAGKQRLLRAVSVRPATIDDLAAIRPLMMSAFRTFSSGAHDVDISLSIASALDSARAVDDLWRQSLLVAWLEGQPVAVAGWHRASDIGHSARIGTIAVDPLFGQLGLGRLMCERAEEDARRAGRHTLVVLASASTQGFFAHMGYETIAYSVRPLEPGVQFSVHHMCKTLPFPAAARQSTARQIAALAAQAGADMHAIGSAGYRAAPTTHTFQELGLVEDLVPRRMLSKASH